jgi:large subunit ribosomal protein L7/L12
LQTTLKISDIASVPAVPAPTVAVATPDSNEDSPAQQQSEFTVKLTGFADGTKAKVIKEIKTIMEGMNLVQVPLYFSCWKVLSKFSALQAKKFVEDAPQIVRKEVSKEEAEELKKILETAGATVQLE